MKTPEQLKGAIRNIAQEKGLHAQEVLQIFMCEYLIVYHNPNIRRILS